MRILMCYLAVCVLLLSCKIVKYAPMQDFRQNSNVLPFELKSHRMYVNTRVDSIDTKFIYDTGAGNTILREQSLVPPQKAKKSIKFGKSRLPDGSTLKNTFIQSNIVNDMYYYKNELVQPIFRGKMPCQEKAEHTGVLGMNYINAIENPMFLFDFEKKEIKNLSTESFNETKSQGFFPVKSKFFGSNKHFYIYMSINGIEEKFLFDTGNSFHGVVINDSTRVKHPDIALVGQLAQTVKGLARVGEFNYYLNRNITVSGQPIKTDIAYSSTLPENNVGLSFIKNFNWLVDHKNKSVFLKPIATTEPNKIQYQTNYVIPTDDNELTIGVTTKGSINFKLGDIIKSVNNEKVDENNLCEMAKLLNSTPDWSGLNLLVEQSEK